DSEILLALGQAHFDGDGAPLGAGNEDGNLAGRRIDAPTWLAAVVDRTKGARLRDRFAVDLDARGLRQTMEVKAVVAGPEVERAFAAFGVDCDGRGSRGLSQAQAGALKRALAIVVADTIVFVERGFTDTRCRRVRWRKAVDVHGEWVDGFLRGVL